ncbi:hypothetical protein GCM10012275_54990 [Longimycelium tulufanense]|uniref:site-specific DNA-methyltransferase (adenine-specific) n=1 Tax=Longimycelium tulufanense TaxID=907463 RepID=A0A8J3CKK7_9PSEU|nr:N-6 DNA methylase [Longimycelium tulufanense]GGM77318.1 hypothetical protein GCM10012275_54990 [Longimycelium tulufanense]
MSRHPQPSLPSALVAAAQNAVTELAEAVPHQTAVTWVHAGAVAQHAVQVGFGPAGVSIRSVLDRVAELHPGLAPFGDLAAELDTIAEKTIVEVWRQHQLMPDDHQIRWWTYPLGDLYQTLSCEARKNRALCQTPWWISELLLHVSMDRAAEVWQRPLLIDPACGTGHLLIESFHRVYRGSGRGITDDGRDVADALGCVHGVDLDPYAVLVARYRLLTMAWADLQHRTDLTALAELPVHVAAANSLLAEDEPLLEHGGYHVVVTNPPYVTPKDATVRERIRGRYPEVCHQRYCLALPFHALMMRLLVDGGWCAQLTANSFMKREFGRKYIEQWLPQYDMQWVIDTSGVYIPGHGTPTVILVHRNQPPSSDTVRTVVGHRGEPRVPDDPAQGLVWQAIRQAVYNRESAERFVRGAEAAWRADHPGTAPEPPQVLAPRETPRQLNLFDLLEIPDTAA